MFFKIAKGCKNWLIFSAIISLFLTCAIILTILSSYNLLKNVIFLFTIISWLITLFLLFFFRDPKRQINEGFTACADGKIRSIKKIKKDEDIGECYNISTFMNIYDVHVNRMPTDGQIIEKKHIEGSYLPAFSKESEKNERIILKIKTNYGLIKIVQIAGLIARRIVPYVKKHDKLKKGEKIGIIRLGSRVDVYIPTDKVKKIFVKKNDRVKAGVTKIAEIND